MTTSGLWSEVTGTGPRLVLVHGAMDRASSFARVARRLPDFELVRYDRRGYGRSLGVGPPSGVEDQIADLLDVIGDDPAMVFGHSYGGTIALATAARAPGAVTGVVAYECPMPWSEWWPGNSAGAAAVASAHDPEEAGELFMRRMIGDERWKRLPPSTKAARRAEGATLTAEIEQLRAPHAPAFDPADVKVPVVVAHGSEGAAHHARSVREIAAMAPDAELHRIEGAGHPVHLTHAPEVEVLIRRLADRLARNG